jgi:hypothetical protein
VTKRKGRAQGEAKMEDRGWKIEFRRRSFCGLWNGRRSDSRYRAAHSVSGESPDRPTRGGRAPRLALDPWLISCAPIGHSVGGCADGFWNLCFICANLWLRNWLLHNFCVYEVVEPATSATLLNANYLIRYICRYRALQSATSSWHNEPSKRLRSAEDRAWECENGINIEHRTRRL